MGILNNFRRGQNPEQKFSVGDEVETTDGDIRGTINRVIHFHPDMKEWVYSVQREDNTSIGVFESQLKPSIVSLAPSVDELDEWMREGRK
jgi:hypothetical protein